jgi:hypothetical protein
VSDWRAKVLREPAGEPGRPFLLATYLVMLIGGAILGVFGALLLPYSVSGTSAQTTSVGGGQAAGHVVAAHVGGGVGQILSVGLLFALIANPLLSLAGLKCAGTRLAAFTPLIGWLVVVLPLASTTSAGDVVLPNGLRSIAYLLVGALAFVAVGTFGRPERGMTSLLRQPLSRNPAPKGVSQPPARKVAKASTRPQSKGRPSRTASKGGRRR